LIDIFTWHGAAARVDGFDGKPSTLVEAADSRQGEKRFMIILKNLTLRRGTKVLLDKTSVTINPGEKVGLVGRNGAGKSTLFGLLNGTLHEDGGRFSMPAQWRMAQVAQDMPETEQSATDFVIDGDTRCSPRATRCTPPKPATTACAWRTPTWRCTTPATRCRSARAGADPRPRLQGAENSTTRSTASPAAGACACNWRAR
jgi:energy-coupling factor transporter ATP-binding protein EcfA2